MPNFIAIAQYWKHLAVKDIDRGLEARVSKSYYKALSAWAASVATAFDHTFLADNIKPTM